MGGERMAAPPTPTTLSCIPTVKTHYFKCLSISQLPNCSTCTPTWLPATHPGHHNLRFLAPLFLSRVPS